MAINQKELNENSEKVNLGEAYIKTLKDQVKNLNKKITTKKGDINTKKSNIKSEKDPTQKESLKKELENLNKELEQLKFNLQQIKTQIVTQKNAIDTRITEMIDKEGNEDLKKYVLYTKGKEFDKNIGKYKKEINTIKKVSDLLEQREGAPDNENKGREDLHSSLEQYLNAKNTCEEKENACRMVGVDYKKNKEYQKVKKDFENREADLISKFESLKDIVPLTNLVDDGEFKSVIESLKIIDGKNAKDSIHEGLNSQTKTAERNMQNNMKAVEGIIIEGKDMEVAFKGFSNYNANAKAKSQLPALQKKSLWEIIKHPIQWVREKRSIKQRRAQIEEQQAIESRYENYDESKYNFDNLKGVNVIKKFISRDTKSTLQEIENSRRAEEEGR